MDIKELLEILKRNWLKITGILVGILVIFISGVIVGRKHEKVVYKEHTEYITLPPKTDTIKFPVPVIEKVDTLSLLRHIIKSGLYSEMFPSKTDTFFITKSDSTTIMNDWATERKYSKKLFSNDTLGNLTVNSIVQYNRIQQMDYVFNPVQKQTTITETITRKYLPYVGAGISTFPSAGLELGVFYNQSWGFAVEGNWYFTPQKFDVGIKVLKMF